MARRCGPRPTRRAADIEKIAASIRKWGLTNPVLVDEQGVLIARASGESESSVPAPRSAERVPAHPPRPQAVISECEFGSASSALLERLFTVALEHDGALDGVFVDPDFDAHSDMPILSL